MPLDLPDSSDDLDITSWQSLEPYYTELAERPLSTEDVPEWLADWSRLGELVDESATLLYIRLTQQTEDQERKQKYLNYVREVGPHVQTATHRLKERLLETRWRSDELGTVLKQFEADVELFRDDNVPLLAEERALAARYGEIIAGLSVEFDGAERTLAALEPYLSSPDRRVRESAWRARHELLAGVRAELDELFLQLLGIRRNIAANAGFDNYMDYLWLQYGRFDYTPDDVVTLEVAIGEAVVPLLAAQAEGRRRALGLDALRPWDLQADPYGDDILKPFTTGDELSEGATRIFDRVNRELGDYVRIMSSDGLLDLENRKGKAPGGYCAALAARRRPFIFMNSVGTDRNLQTMLHESGHAFHVFESIGLPYYWQQSVPMEFAEVASMTMELLTSKYLAKAEGGFYSERDADRSRLRHLESIISFLPYMATVNAFQRWLYSQPETTAEELDEAWLGLHEKFVVGADWSGLEETRRGLWHERLHIFEIPFYYVEYAIARLGSLQVWRNSLVDSDQALTDYRRALSLGGTRPLPELFEAAGAVLAFDTASVAETMELVRQKAEELRRGLEGE